MSPTRFGTNLVTRAGRAALTAGIALAGVSAVMCGEPPARGTGPDPRMQAAIEETVSAIAHQEGTASESIASLQTLAAGHRETLLLQLALYLETADGTERSMAGAMLLRQLAFTPREMIETLVPHLEGARPALRRVITEMLGTIDRREGGETDFHVYESWLAGRGGLPPASLVRYLYEVSPDEALLCMRHVYGGTEPRRDVDGALGDMRKILARRDASRTWSDDERRRARAALETLGRDPAWWVRRYAAAILSSSPELGTPALIERLKADADPLVRNALIP
jgi:hypothetical protein